MAKRIGPATPPPEQPPDQTTLPVYPAQGFVFHHSGGTTLEGLRATLKDRGLGSQYLMDRDGTIYTYGGPGSPHMQPNDRYGGAAPGLSNANAVGMEVVARDNADVTPAQVASANAFIQRYYPDTPVYGHGEVNPGHKQADEGMAIVGSIRTARQSGGTAQVAQTTQPTLPPPYAPGRYGVPQTQTPEGAPESYFARLYGTGQSVAQAAPTQEPPPSVESLPEPPTPATTVTPTSPTGPPLPPTATGTTAGFPPPSPPPTLGQTPAPPPPTQLGMSPPPQLGTTPAPPPPQLGESRVPPQLGESRIPPQLGESTQPPPQLGMTPAPPPPPPAQLGMTRGAAAPQLGMTPAPAAPPSSQLGITEAPPPPAAPPKYEAALRLEAAGQLPANYQAALDRVRADKASAPTLPPFTPDSPIYAATAEKYRLPVGLLQAVAHQTTHDPNGAGLMRIDPKHGAPYGLTPTNTSNPYLQVEIAGHMLRDDLDASGGDLNTALAKFHASPEYTRAVMDALPLYSTSDPRHTAPVAAQGEPGAPPPSPDTQGSGAVGPFVTDTLRPSPPFPDAAKAAMQRRMEEGLQPPGTVPGLPTWMGGSGAIPIPDVPPDAGPVTRTLHHITEAGTTINRAVEKYDPFRLVEKALGSFTEAAWPKVPMAGDVLSPEQAGDLAEWIPLVASVAPMVPGASRFAGEVVGTPAGLERRAARIASAEATRVGGQRAALQQAQSVADRAVAYWQQQVAGARTAAERSRAEAFMERATNAAQQANAGQMTDSLREAIRDVQASLPAHVEAAVTEATAAQPGLLSQQPTQNVPGNVARRGTLLERASEGRGPYGGRPTARSLRAQSVVRGNPRGSINLRDVPPAVRASRLSDQAAQNALDHYVELTARAGEANTAQEAQALLREAVDTVRAHFPGIQNPALDTLEAASQHMDALENLLASTGATATRLAGESTARHAVHAGRAQAATQRIGPARAATVRARETQTAIGRRLAGVGPSPAATAEIERLQSMARQRHGGSVPWRAAKFAGRTARRLGYAAAGAAGIYHVARAVFSPH